VANDKTAIATKAKQANNTDPKSGPVNRTEFRIGFLPKTLAAEGAAAQYTRANLNAIVGK
jgi:hypothetical protein